MIIYGFHALESLLEADQKVHSVHALFKPDSDRLKKVRPMVQKKNIPWREYSQKERARFESEFRRLGGDIEELESTQGIFAQVPDPAPVELAELLKLAREKEEYPVILFLDSITDPQNLGSMLRSSAFFNVAGIAVTEHRSSPLTAAAIKISSGGFAHVPIARVTNLVQGLEAAKEAGFWVVGLSEHATELFERARVDAPIALVVGNEEKGIRPLTEKNCDYTLSLPALGPIKSLNAATAAAVALALLRHRQQHDALNRK